MPSYTTLLGLALPTVGQTNWGGTVNNEITSLLDSAVSGTTVLNTDTDRVLTSTTGAANEARQAILLWTAGGSTTRYITAPAQSKPYVVINRTSGTQSIVLRGAGPTVGITVLPNEACVAAWDGIDFAKVASNVGVDSISFGSTGLTPSTATTGAVTVAGTLAVANGGTGQSSALTQYGVVYGATAAAMGVTSAGTVNQVLHGNPAGAPSWGAVDLSLEVSGTLGPSNGGTGHTSYSNGELLIGNGGVLNKNTLTGGAGISISNGAGTIQINNASPMTYPGVGIAVSSGSFWNSSLAIPSGNLVGTSATQTLTDKRINPRVVTGTTPAPPYVVDPDIATYDMYAYTALATGITINAPIGSPVDGNRLIFRLKDNGSARSLTWDPTYRNVGFPLPTTTVAGKVTYVGCMYNSDSATWDVLAVSTQP